MRYGILLFLLCCFILPASGLLAQTISGTVIDMETNLPIADVSVENQHTNALGFTDSTGKFSITVDKAQLLEFRKVGYRTEHMRIPSGTIPPYVKVYITRGLALSAEIAKEESHTYHNDSLRYYQLYKKELAFPRMTTLDIINHPFSALSKQSQRIWAFQKEYTYFEQQKYVDYRFNETLVASLTNLSGDTLKRYMRFFRPTYQMLQGMQDYDYFIYVRRTGEQWLRRLRDGGSRGSGG